MLTILLRFSLFLQLVFLISCNTGKSRFEMLSPELTHIEFQNVIMEDDTFNIMHDELMYNGGGVGIGDFNNDGYSDLIFTGNKSLSRLYLNVGDFTFQDNTSRVMGLDSSQWYSGVSVVDINADGWDDFYLTATHYKDVDRRKNKLFINMGIQEDGLPTFTEASEEYGLEDNSFSVHAAFFDYDLDGDLDLYVINDVVSNVVPVQYRKKIVDGTSPNNDQLYRNDGNGHFANVTIDAGVTLEGYALGISIVDLNKDGYPDIYVSNDYISNDLLYINQGDGTFKNEIREYIAYQSKFSMGNDAADVNNDGFSDIITLDMLPENYGRKKRTIEGNLYYEYINNRMFSIENQYIRNMLHVHSGLINDQLVGMIEVGQMSGIYQTEWSWSPLFADFDNDGDKDLAITNGFPKDLTDKDFSIYKANFYGHLVDDAEILPLIPVTKVPNYGFENNGNAQFSNVSEGWGFNTPSFSNGAAFVDLDNDGDLDYVVNNINDFAFVYKNNTQESDSKQNYLRVKLHDTTSQNIKAIGAKVELWANGIYQYTENFLSRGYISSVEPILHFGLSNAVIVDSLRVMWPDGRYYSVLYDLPVNQVMVVKKDSVSLLSVKELPQTKKNYLFTESKPLLSYTHQQDNLVDFFAGQTTILKQFSMKGPVMTPIDVNNDGKMDLIIASTNKDDYNIFMNRGDSLVALEILGLSNQAQLMVSDMKVADIDADGDSDLVCVTGGYSDEASKCKHFLYFNEGDKFRAVQLPLPPIVASAVELFDFDHDGDLDIFVSSRIKFRAFPHSPPSYLLINNNNVFELYSDSFELGLVTDLCQVDYDEDGWTDILAVREWDTPIILLNKKGKSLDFFLPDELKDAHGLWASVTPIDVDADGDFDYIFGNMGENHRFEISKKYPMRLYALDLDGNGYVDPIMTAYWKNEEDDMTEYPINYLDELVSQSPYFKKRSISYTSFSKAAFSELVSKEMIQEGTMSYINTMSNAMLINDGKKSFHWEVLPKIAQGSPITKVLVDDFNNDGIDDAILAGNDYSFDVSTGYMDANKGLLLMGGKDKYYIMEPRESGLVLNGQIGSLLKMEINGTSYLVACSYQGKLTMHKIAYP